ncbi:hypothetical protein B0T26DRAFT_37597 [Lasiosphaeria miniovina]|uniref:Uncharacterized protein n=1 Tax=Lasiosphaeria miniovina TaxID=1954250 RepID=A0AA40BGH9_9PEZI|nr:uncharacterized protein B0T26DRAFT_37597 [Lasiosphaeria miniovina]KAK0733812.1 hypothetical protein B0T26DRAFT_37597 [Lasiosphaeria miniovina]
MVSFFGIKFGDKKKKPDAKAVIPRGKQPQQWTKVDQNLLGEGQYFGHNVNNRGVLNGSIRSVSRTGTPSPNPYAHMAAASMYDLTKGAHGRNGSFSSAINLKPHASDANLRVKFNANNGSSHSLAAPMSGYGSRPAAGPRPSTSSGPTKAWVNPLDIHFMKAAPSGTPAPKSPLAPRETDKTIPTSQGADAADKKEQKENEAGEEDAELEQLKKTARLGLERLVRQQSNEMTQASNSTPQPREPSMEQSRGPARKQSDEQFRDQTKEQGYSQQASANNLPAVLGPAFRGNTDQRPGSRNGPPTNGPDGVNGQAPRPAPSLLVHGPPRHGPPTQSLPHLPNQAAQKSLHQGTPQGLPPGFPPGPPGSSKEAPRGQGPRLAGPTPSEMGPGGLSLYRPITHIQPQTAGPANPHGSGLQNNRPYSPKPQAPPAARAPGLVEQGLQKSASTGSGPGPNTNGYGSLVLSRGPGSQTLGVSMLNEPSPETSPMLYSSSFKPGSRPSFDDMPIEQFARPIIRDVQAKRDTLTSYSPRRLSMKIEKLEKSLLTAQQTSHLKTFSTSSSQYTDDLVSDDDEDDDDPILTQPEPLHLSPPLAIAEFSRPKSPIRVGLPLRGPGPRRPTLDEYGVSSNLVATAPAVVTTPSAASGAVRHGAAPGLTIENSGNNGSHPGLSDNNSNIMDRLGASSPPSRATTPQLHHHNKNWTRDPSPAPVLHLNTTSPTTRNALSPAVPSPIESAAFDFNFDFGPNAAPPTPDSTTWPLGSTSLSSSPDPAATPTFSSLESARPPRLDRSHVPPPLHLKFPAPGNGSGGNSGFRRDAGPWTPPLARSDSGIGHDNARPSTAMGGSTFSSNSGKNDAPAAAAGQADADQAMAEALGIGVARGLSVRNPPQKQRKATYMPPLSPLPAEVAGPAPVGVDAFGTGFI